MTLSQEIRKTLEAQRMAWNEQAVVALAHVDAIDALLDEDPDDNDETDTDTPAKTTKKKRSTKKTASKKKAAARRKPDPEDEESESDGEDIEELRDEIRGMCASLVSDGHAPKPLQDKMREIGKGKDIGTMALGDLKRFRSYCEDLQLDGADEGDVDDNNFG